MKQHIKVVAKRIATAYLIVLAIAGLPVLTHVAARILRVIDEMSTPRYTVDSISFLAVFTDMMTIFMQYDSSLPNTMQEHVHGGGIVAAIYAISAICVITGFMVFKKVKEDEPVPAITPSDSEVPA